MLFCSAETEARNKKDLELLIVDSFPGFFSEDDGNCRALHLLYFLQNHGFLIKSSLFLLQVFLQSHAFSGQCRRR